MSAAEQDPRAELVVVVPTLTTGEADGNSGRTESCDSIEAAFDKRVSEFAVASLARLTARAERWLPCHDGRACLWRPSPRTGLAALLGAGEGEIICHWYSE